MERRIYAVERGRYLIWLSLKRIIVVRRRVRTIWLAEERITVRFGGNLFFVLRAEESIFLDRMKRIYCNFWLWVFRLLHWGFCFITFLCLWPKVFQLLHRRFCFITRIQFIFDPALRSFKDLCMLAWVLTGLLGTPKTATSSLGTTVATLSLDWIFAGLHLWIISSLHLLLWRHFDEGLY